MVERHRGPRPSTWLPRTDRGRAVLTDVLDRYRQHEAEDTLPRSGRGSFYDLRPHGFGRGVTYLKRPQDRAGWYDPTAPKPRGGPDALPVPVLDAIVRDAISRHHVPARREQVERDERDARDRLPDAIRDALDEDPA